MKRLAFLRSWCVQTLRACGRSSSFPRTRESRTPLGSRVRGNDGKQRCCRGEFASVVPAPLLTLATPTWAHVHSLTFDFVCTTDETLPGLTLLPFLLLAGIGIARAVARHRKDR